MTVLFLREQHAQMVFAILAPVSGGEWFARGHLANGARLMKRHTLAACVVLGAVACASGADAASLTAACLAAARASCEKVGTGFSR
jgi:hypothetical protein